MSGTAKHLTLQKFTELFHRAFNQTHNVVLCGGAPEPIFLPASAERPQAEIHYVGDSLPSALHEVSHWLLAGRQRHHLVDYGYWYAADGRGASEQEKFESVEVRPQALEWILSSMIGREFVVSCDNIRLQNHNSQPFKSAVRAQALDFIKGKLPTRARQLSDYLFDHCGSRTEFREYWDLVDRSGLLPN